MDIIDHILRTCQTPPSAPSFPYTAQTREARGVGIGCWKGVILPTWKRSSHTAQTLLEGPMVKPWWNHGPWPSFQSAKSSQFYGMIWGYQWQSKQHFGCQPISISDTIGSSLRICLCDGFRLAPLILGRNCHEFSTAWWFQSANPEK